MKNTWMKMCRQSKDSESQSDPNVVAFLPLQFQRQNQLFSQTLYTKHNSLLLENILLFHLCFPFSCFLLQKYYLTNVSWERTLQGVWLTKNRRMFYHRSLFVIVSVEAETIYSIWVEGKINRVMTLLQPSKKSFVIIFLITSIYFIYNAVTNTLVSHTSLLMLVYKAFGLF